MKLSTRSRYGTRLMLDMAQRYQEGPIQLGAIASRQNISVKYLEQLIIPLKRAHYVNSVRGSRGGHMLARSPDEITVGEIVKLLEGGVRLTDCTAHPETCERADQCMMRLVWKEATQAIQEKLDGLSLADVLKMAQEEGKEVNKDGQVGQDKD